MGKNHKTQSERNKLDKKKEKKDNKRKTRSNTSKCSSNIDIFTLKKFTKTSHVIKFQPDPTVDVYQCYERKSLAKYISSELGINKNIYEITDPMTRLPYTLPFLIHHFANEILEHVRVGINELIEDMTDGYPDERIFTGHLSRLMNFIDFYHDVWVILSNKKMYKFQSDIEHDVQDLFEDRESFFEKRTINEIREYFNNLEHENAFIIDDGSSSSRDSRDSRSRDSRSRNSRDSRSRDSRSRNSRDSRNSSRSRSSRNSSRSRSSRNSRNSIGVPQIVL